MAEAALLLAAKRIGVAVGEEALNLISSQLSKEVSLLTQLPSSMKRIRREFVVMQSMLSQIDTNKDNNQALVSWLEEVRKLANGVQDIIDEYIHLLGRPHGRGCSNYVKKMIKRSPNILAWHRIASELKELETDLLHLSQIKERWTTVPNGGAGSSSSYAFETQLRLSDHSRFIDEDKLVGIKENKNTLTKWLGIDQEPARSIISVWGMGGLGKTTLVDSVYKSESKNFGCHAWIPVSQTYKIEDLLRTLVKELYGKVETIPNDIDTMDHKKLKETLQSFLERRRYLIILDDIWSPVAFQDISDAVVDNELGSRIVITTRSAEVASLAPDNHKLELKALKEKDAWDLFCKMAFWKETDRKCPQRLEDLANKIFQKCQGLPLAIVSIGSLLFLREKTESEWQKIYNQLDWELDNNPNLDRMKQILNLSYQYLPIYLKNCFLYCSMYPEDYLLRRKKLIRLWISEGFVEERGANTMEEVAEDYLKELVHRCMLHVVERNEFGRIKYCRMHDLVRELAISTSRKENFTMACDNSETVRIGSDVRRLAVHRCNNAIVSGSNLPQLRSFVVFDTTISPLHLLSSVSSYSRYLTVLDLEDIPIARLPDEVGDLFNLHYLGLRGTKVKVLPKSVGKLHELQTLDLMKTEIKKLPHGITKLKKLRHLFAEKVLDSKNRTFLNRRGVKAPKGLWNLRDLQTFQAVEASMGTVKGLGNLTQLRSLRIWKVRSIHCAQLCASIAKMHFLSFLAVNASDESEELQLVGLNPPPQNLLKLNLRGRLEEGLLKSPMFESLGYNLRKLSLSWCGLQEDPLPSLSYMSNLAFLRLQRAFDGQLLCFLGGWFPNLKELYLLDMAQLSQVVAEEGSLERLEYIFMRDLQALKDLPQGIKFLTSLQTIYAENLHPEFRRKFPETDGRSEFQDISNFVYFFKKEGETFIPNQLL